MTATAIKITVRPAAETAVDFAVVLRLLAPVVHVVGIVRRVILLGVARLN
ncbi:MAG: hypothetical protein J5555_00895 [Firmicutes bacterium]|nr:hypothetical protein [Bacillota bacterium]